MAKILLVDDTKTNIDVLVQTLKDTYKLGVALNGKKAIEYTQKNRVDLILLDIPSSEFRIWLFVTWFSSEYAR